MENTLVERKNYSLVGPESIQAMQKGLAEANWYTVPVPRDKMLELLERRDGPAVRDTMIWFGLLFGFGYLMFAWWGHWYVVFPIMAYSVIYASSSDSRWHESSHGTAFKTDWMNEWLYEIASFMVFRQSVSWRWSHTRHHSDTIIVGRDPEIATPRPPDIKGILLNLFAYKSVPPEFRRWMLHLVGKIDAEEQQYIPQSQYPKVFLVARVWLLIYVAVIFLAIYFQTFLPLFYIGLPTLLGSYLLVVYGLTQHAGLAENVLDHRLNCRTVYMNRVNRFLYWNMNYHLEHHMFPLVPYHNLPKLHELIKDYCPKPYNGIIEAYREIIPTLRRQVHEPTYFVERKIPELGRLDPAPQTNRIIGDITKAVAGKLAVCSIKRLAKGDVLRFDVGGSTYAIYRTDQDAYYATDGICTHGNTHLADGLVIGEQIECPKHNGRFSIVDGSPQRAPVCIGLRTYEISVTDGTIWIDIENAGGLGQQDAAKERSFKVVSNENVTSYIKELILEPEGGPINYNPGEYIQIEIPVYEKTFDSIDVGARFFDFWKDKNIFRLHVSNFTKTRRNYSMASNPSTDRQVRFNVRIALPPPGLNCNAGVGSSYVFGLNPGDTVKAIGPFGDFHIKETNAEMIYIGGGAGMAPLRSHISHLLETKKSRRKISYYYGARSSKDVFYEDYFNQLSRDYSNFDFHIALSDAVDENWKGSRGYIHQVVLDDYLSKHASPQRIEYYLCGPPLMIAACQEMLSQLGVPEKQIAFDEF